MFKKKKYNIRINSVEFIDLCIVINWSAKNIVFGQLTIYQKDGGYLVDTECMSKAFYKEVLEQAKKHIIKKAEIIK